MEQSHGSGLAELSPAEAGAINGGEMGPGCGGGNSSYCFGKSVGAFLAYVFVSPDDSLWGIGSRAGEYLAR
ncbi:MAG: hypothetical protein ABJD07_02195 [Gemmatimonadaceae bacterium]